MQSKHLCGSTRKNAARINNGTAVKAFAIGEKVAAKPPDEGDAVNTLLLFLNISHTVLQ